jgi:hypothetical protein
VSIKTETSSISDQSDSLRTGTQESHEQDSSFENLRNDIQEAFDSEQEQIPKNNNELNDETEESPEDNGIQTNFRAITGNSGKK